MLIVARPKVRPHIWPCLLCLHILNTSGRMALHTYKLSKTVSNNRSYFGLRERTLVCRNQYKVARGPLKFALFIEIQDASSTNPLLPYSHLTILFQDDLRSISCYSFSVRSWRFYSPSWTQRRNFHTPGILSSRT